MGVARSKVAAMAIEQRPAVCQKNLGFIDLGCMSVSDRNVLNEVCWVVLRDD